MSTNEFWLSTLVVFFVSVFVGVSLSMLEVSLSPRRWYNWFRWRMWRDDCYLCSCHIYPWQEAYTTMDGYLFHKKCLRKN